MSWIITPFNNTDLHNIYEAIVSGGGGGDTLAGQLLNGTAYPQDTGGFYPTYTAGSFTKLDSINAFLDGTINPSNVGGFYPAAIQGIASTNFDIYGLLYGDNLPNTDNAAGYPYFARNTSDQTENTYKLLNGSIDPPVQPSGSYGFYPYYTEQTHNNIQTILSLFQGWSEPTSYTGFYPTNILAQSASLSNIEGAANSINKLINGTGEPLDNGGFYPSHVIEDTNVLNNIWGEAQKIAAHTDQIQALTAGSLVFGTATGGTAQKASGTGYSTPDLAAAAAVNFMNAKSGSNIVINLNFTDGGGANGHSWTLVFVTLL